MADLGERSGAAIGGFGLTSVIGAGLRAMIARRVELLSDRVHWRVRTAELQVAQLRSVLKRASGTQFGRGHDFARLAGLADAELVAAFRSAVPMADYEGYRAAIARMRESGEPDVLWPGVVMNYAQTSGTTAGDKYMPVSDEMMKSNFRASLDIFGHAARFGVSLPRLTGGKLLFLGGSTELSKNEHGIKTGDLSGIVAPLIRWPLSEIYSPGHEIALMSHWPSKIEAMARATVGQDVRMISGMPSWTLKLVDRVVELARDQGRRVRSLRDVWPNFTLFVHGGVKYSPFEPRIREAWSGGAEDVPYRLEVYPASEGFIAMQDERGEPGLRLLSDIGIFYEFVPLEEINDPAPRAFAAHEVEKGQRYVVVMTTCAGFSRYIIGDVVEFDSVPDRPEWLGGGGGDGPCRLRIVGRHKHFINAFGENIIVEHIENAVARAAAETSVTVGEFTAAPVYPGEGRRPGLELAVECDAGLAGPALDRFRDAFDRTIKAQNVDYTTKRTDDVGMAPPTVTVLPTGTFHRWMQSRGKLGGQHKCPRCANHREIIDAAKRFAGR